MRQRACAAPRGADAITHELGRARFCPCFSLRVVVCKSAALCMRIVHRKCLHSSSVAGCIELTADRSIFIIARLACASGPDSRANSRRRSLMRARPMAAWCNVQTRQAGQSHVNGLADHPKEGMSMLTKKRVQRKDHATRNGVVSGRPAWLPITCGHGECRWGVRDCWRLLQKFAPLTVWKHCEGEYY
jgi:hypothetical protein